MSLEIYKEEYAILMCGENALVPTRFEVLLATLVEDMSILLSE